MACLRWRMLMWVHVLSVVFVALPSIIGYTDPRDVFAINQLYISLGSPNLLGWVDIGGDPCGPPTWQGVECVNANITAIKINAANLGGELSEEMGSFASIILIDLTGNYIKGSIPSQLPTTLRSLFLSSNQLTGSIPDSLSQLGQLTDLSLNGNNLTGPIPNAFEPLTSLINLDLSGNSLTGVLPPSMESLSSLTSLHLQDNKLSGFLNVLQDLPLADLNVANNLFSGPIPPKLLSIPNFRRDGNPFNTSILPSPPMASPLLSPSDAPSPQLTPTVVFGPSSTPLPESRTREKNSNTKTIKSIAIAGLLVIVLLALGLCLFMSRLCKGRKDSEKFAMRHNFGKNGVFMDTYKRDKSTQNPVFQAEKDQRNVVLQPAIGVGGSQRKKAFKQQEKDHAIDMTGVHVTPLQTNPLPFPLLAAERIVADPNFDTITPKRSIPKIDSVKFFTIASLQQYTNSFSQENLIGRGTLGTAYRAQLPDGKVLAVKKLDKAVSGRLSEREFLDLVSTISKLRHENIVELSGYCLEHGQHLLVYDYCRKGMLYEALHLDEEIKKKLSWNVRMRMALQAAKALEYLHEVSRPPVAHRNFKSTNLLLHDDFEIQVSDCGLASLLSPSHITQLQGSGYGGPELELGSYSYPSDVYSFGVVMLELLTGRQAHDRHRPRGEQYLVRWAFSRLHDIDALSRMVDPSLKGSYPSKSLSRLADIISLCIQPEPEFRPPMSEIVQKLLNMIQNNS